MLRYLWIPCMFCAFLLACGGGDAEAEGAGDSQAGGAAAKALAGGIDGESIFKTRCVTCHGSKGNMGANGAANLQQSELPLAERVKVIVNGRKAMTAFKNILSPDEIEAVAAYSLTLKQ